MLFVAAGLFLLAYLPGALLFRLPWWNRKGRAALDAEERVFWAMLASVSMTLLSGFALAGMGRFSIRALLIAAASLSSVFALLGHVRLLYRGTAARVSPTALIPVALVVLGAWMFHPPSEYIIGGRDPGVYMNEGVRIAQRGALLTADPLVATVPASARHIFFPPSPTIEDYYSLRFMGVFVMDPARGTLLSQFPHLFPVSIAIGYALDGLTGARRTMPFWGILGVLATYFAGARLFGKPVGATAALLLAITNAQVWFARYPASEIMMQPLLIGGLLAFARAHQDRLGLFSVIAGVLLGLPLFFRVEALLVPVAVGAAVAASLLSREHPRAMFIVSFAGTCTAAVYYLGQVTRAYFRYPVALARDIEGWLLAGAILFIAAFLGLAYAGGRPAIAQRLRAAATTVLVLAVVGGALYAYFLRQPGGRLAAGDAFALREYVHYYATVPAFFAALVGYTLAARRHFWRDPALFLTATAFALFFFYKPRIVPEHFWLGRRYIPLIVPFTLLLAAYAALFGLGRAPLDLRALLRNRRAAASTAAGVVFLSLLGSRLWAATNPVRHHVEYAGVIPAIERLAAAFHEDDLLVFESRGVSDLHVLALPLSYIYARNTVVLLSPLPDKVALEEFLAAVQPRYHEVFFLGASGTDLMSAHIDLKKREPYLFRVPEYEQAKGGYPDEVRLKEFRFNVYEFVRRPPPTGDWTLDVGREGDDMYLVRVHGPERSGNTTFRWTRARSLFTILGVTPERPRLVLWLGAGPRPSSAKPAVATVTLDDQILGTFQVGSAFSPYEFTVPPALAERIARGSGAALLRINVDPWTPSALQGGSDTRELGIVVDRIEVTAPQPGA